MARKPKSVPELDTPEKVVEQGKFWLDKEAPWYGFINVAVSETEKEDFLSWRVENTQHVSGMMDDLLAEGMKYGCAYDKENECYIVTLTGCLIAKSNMRACVTTRAGTWAECDALAVWKHYVLCGGNYDDLLTTGRKRSWG